MLGWIRKKMVIPKLALRGGRFSGNGASACNDPYVLGRDCQSSLGMVPRTMHIFPTCLTRVRGWVESQVPWCNVHNVWVGTQEVGASPPLGFPHPMLSVKRVKDNLRLAFIENLFTNREIETNI
jgi:hypothetical protein